MLEESEGIIKNGQSIVTDNTVSVFLVMPQMMSVEKNIFLIIRSNHRYCGQCAADLVVKQHTALFSMTIYIPLLAICVGC
jgi:hypothetical protein